jgi:hypothetical protein
MTSLDVEPIALDGKARQTAGASSVVEMVSSAAAG